MSTISRAGILRTLALCLVAIFAFCAGPNLPAATLTWNNLGGTGNGTTWDTTTNATSQNWNNGAPSFFNNGDTVFFTDGNNGNYNVTLGSSVSVAALTATNTSGTYTVTIPSGMTLTSTGTVTIGQSAVQ